MEHQWIRNFCIRTCGIFCLCSPFQSNPYTLLAQLNLPPKNLILPLIFPVILFLSTSIPYYVAKIGNLHIYIIIFRWYIIIFVVILAIEFVGIVMFFSMFQEVFEFQQTFTLYLCPHYSFPYSFMKFPYSLLLLLKKYGNKCDIIQFHPFPLRFHPYFAVYWPDAESFQVNWSSIPGDKDWTSIAQPSMVNSTDPCTFRASEIHRSNLCRPAPCIWFCYR